MSMNKQKSETVSCIADILLRFNVEKLTEMLRKTAIELKAEHIYIYAVTLCRVRMWNSQEKILFGILE